MRGNYSSTTAPLSDKCPDLWQMTSFGVWGFTFHAVTAFPSLYLTANKEKRSYNHMELNPAKTWMNKEIDSRLEPLGKNAVLLRQISAW